MLNMQPSPRPAEPSRGARSQPVPQAARSGRPNQSQAAKLPQRAPQAAPLLRQNLTSGRFEIEIVLLPGFPLFDLAALCDTFAAANRQAEQPIFSWRLLSLDGKPVANALGAPTAV